MHKDTGGFHTTAQAQALIDAGTAEPDDFLFLSAGEEVLIKGHTFVVCDVRGNRLMLRSKKQKPTIKEQRLVNYKEEGKMPKALRFRPDKDAST